MPVHSEHIASIKITAPITAKASS